VLIFDNVDEESTLSNIKMDLLPPGGFDQVLITGRLTSLRSVGHAVEVPFLNAKESKDLLGKCYPSFRMHEDDRGALTLLLDSSPLP